MGLQNLQKERICEGKNASWSMYVVEGAPLARMTATVEGKVGPRAASLGLRWSTLHLQMSSRN